MCRRRFTGFANSAQSLTWPTGVFGSRLKTVRISASKQTHARAVNLRNEFYIYEMASQLQGDGGAGYPTVHTELCLLRDEFAEHTRGNRHRLDLLYGVHAYEDGDQ